LCHCRSRRRRNLLQYPGRTKPIDVWRRKAGKRGINLSFTPKKPAVNANRRHGALAHETSGWSGTFALGGRALLLWGTAASAEDSAAAEEEPVAALAT
jgi:hypothetical protein